MPTATYIALANTTLSSNTATVTFSSIPATYRDLVVVFTGSATTTDLRFRLNGDTGGNYNDVTMQGTGSGSGTSASNPNETQYPFEYIPSSGQTQSIIHIMDYSATDKHKSILIRNAQPSFYVAAKAGRWANTAAVNTILFRIGDGGSYTSGSTFALYGIVS